MNAIRSHRLGLIRLVLGVALLGMPAQLARAADPVTLSNVGFAIGQTSFRLPRVEFSGANLDQQQLSAQPPARWRTGSRHCRRAP